MIIRHYNKSVIIVLLFCVCFNFISCTKFCSLEEVKRLTSHDNKIDAVIIKKNYGATSSYVYDLYVVPKGKNVDSKDAKFTADHIKELELIWLQDRLLQITYKKARIFHFSNFWQFKEVNNFSYVVEIQLNPLSNEFSLSKKDRWIK